ncbi:DUF397 domain-containing protein [Actinoallomurus purpureus]|uniref:DUF397 domain-containing protein n=1 Tax=Actinoallomurus purpureus TaxID=478114 RepID=UPI002092AD49|nr:DUF397 domain-containing protein [Actinoallomurus purpureus]MCO6009065.1 DUF397 domain-containing protein [Actinoallomurus purpureus]
MQTTNPQEWTTSSYSASGCACVEWRVRKAVEVRDSKAGDAGGIATLTPGAWTGFINSFRAMSPEETEVYLNSSRA